MARLVLRPVGETLNGLLASASDVRVASAYFSPPAWLRDALVRTEARIVVSGEWQVNNPGRLGAFGPRLRFIPREPHRLHAKLAIGADAAGTQWLLLGSANHTASGLGAHDEACLLLKDPEDAETIMEAAAAFEAWWTRALPLDGESLADALRAWDLRPVLRPPAPPGGADEAPPGGLWVLKAWDDGRKRSFWPEFVDEQVIAIGWSDLDVDPWEAGEAALRASVARAYGQGSMGASRLLQFRKVQPGDLVLVCEGYSANDTGPLRIQGFARAGSVTFTDRASKWWRMKRKAVLQAVDADVPRSILQEVKGSLQHAIHRLAPGEAGRVLRRLSEEGIEPQV